MSQPVAEQQLGFTCAACGKQFRWKPELAGKSVKCKCETTIRVPDAAGGVAQPKAARTAASTPAGAGHATGTVPPPPPFAAGVRGAARAAEVPPRAAPAQQPKRPPAKLATPAPATRTAAPAARQAPKSTPPPPPPPRAAAAADEDDGGLAGLYALADQEAAGADDAVDVADSTRCPNCRGFLAPEAVLCTSCGYDRRKGKVLSTTAVADKPKRGLFGLGKPKKEDPNQKKPVDKMAPQGSFAVGIGVSAALAAVAGGAWYGVAYATGLDLYFLVALVGAAAGLGMQIGQKGYSTLGGFAAVGIALVAILAARAAVVLAIVMPLVNVAGDTGEDPRVVMTLIGVEFLERGINPEKTSVKTFNEVKETAVRKARDLTPEQKQALIAAADAEGLSTAEIESMGDDATNVFQLVVFGGVKPFIFLLAALGLAFRTANGGVSG